LVNKANGLTNRFVEAFIYAFSLHNGQYRKGTQIPYIAHLMAVTALVLEGGGDEDQAIAALLHDAAEDQGGLETLREIRKRFGKRVALIVEECSDTFSDPKPPWRKRKQTYLTHLRDASEDSHLVSLADKLHNAQSILWDLQESGDEIFEKFNGGKEGTLWYYDQLVNAFQNINYHFYVEILKRVVAQIKSNAQPKRQP
jgi:(p)ppGpp synthase/HD superfamily hydrolase